MGLLFFYHLLTKLREGNVFNRVYLPFCSRGSAVTITHNALDLTMKGPPTPSPDMEYMDPLALPPTDMVHEDPHLLPVLTSGGHQSMYGWQVGRIHPTEMLSCFNFFLSRASPNDDKSRKVFLFGFALGKFLHLKLYFAYYFEQICHQTKQHKPNVFKCNYICFRLQAAQQVSVNSIVKSDSCPCCPDRRNRYRFRSFLTFFHRLTSQEKNCCRFINMFCCFNFGEYTFLRKTVKFVSQNNHFSIDR